MIKPVYQTSTIAAGTRSSQLEVWDKKQQKYTSNDSVQVWLMGQAEYVNNNKNLA